jgi:hypothetical protein
MYGYDAVFKLLPAYIGLKRSHGFIKNPNGPDTLIGAAKAERQMHSPF